MKKNLNVRWAEIWTREGRTPTHWRGCAVLLAARLGPDRLAVKGGETVGVDGPGMSRVTSETRRIRVNRSTLRRSAMLRNKLRK